MTGKQRVSLAVGALFLGGLLTMPAVGEAGCHRARRHRCCARTYYNACNTGCQTTVAYQAPVAQCCGTSGYAGQQSVIYATDGATSSTGTSTNTVAPPPPAEAAPTPQ